jgi:hypothetical protein
VRALQAILRDLEIGEEEIELYLEVIQESLGEVKDLIVLLNREGVPSEEEILMTADGFSDRLWQPTASAFNSLRETGKLDLITDAGLRRKIVEYFDTAEPYYYDIRLFHSERNDRLNSILDEDIKYVPDSDFSESEGYHKALIVPPEQFPSDPDLVSLLISFKRSAEFAESRFLEGLKDIQDLREIINQHLETL